MKKSASLTLTGVVVALFLIVAVLCGTAQELKTVNLEQGVVSSPSPLIGRWAKGSWEANGNSSIGGRMEIEVLTDDGDRLTGRVRVAYWGASTCAVGWEGFTGTKREKEISLRYNLGGRCGSVETILLIDPKKNNLLWGTYTSEAGTGSVRLTRQ